MSKTPQWAIQNAFVAVILAACTSKPVTAPPIPTSSTEGFGGPAVGGAITVFAAASLREAFQEAGKNLERDHAGVKIQFNFAGSQQLVEQIRQGAPADVFASANQRLMDAAVKTGRIDAAAPQVFARNRLVVIVPANNPGQVRTPTDLAKPGLKIVLANKTVPVGGYTLDFLDKASASAAFGKTFGQSVLSNVVSYEEDVRAVFNKVALGEADAGVVYSSDVVTDKAAQVVTIAIPDELNTIARYPFAVLRDSANPQLASVFVAYMQSPAGQAVLTRRGFIAAVDTPAK